MGSVSNLLAPLVDQIRKHVLAATKIHADDTPVPVLAPGMGKTKTARLWTYVRDDRPAGQDLPPAVWFTYSEDRKGEHPRQHLSRFIGILQADGYSGFHHLYECGRIVEAACWAHVRRKFYDIQVANESATAAEVINRIGTLYDIEPEIRGKPADLRREIRQARARPLVDQLHRWHGRTISLRAPMPGANVPLLSIRCLGLPSSAGLIQNSIFVQCWSALLIIPSIAFRSACPGIRG